jgi:hypothetical protein
MSALRAKSPRPSRSGSSCSCSAPPASARPPPRSSSPTPTSSTARRARRTTTSSSPPAGRRLPDHRHERGDQEVKALLTEKHDYRTLVIDPITTLYNDLLDKCEQKVGSDFGRHYGAANKTMKRLANLIMALDMNVVVTAHAKAEYGENLQARLHVRRLEAARLLVRPGDRAGQEGQEALREGRQDAHRDVPRRGRVRVVLRRDQEALRRRRCWRRGGAVTLATPEQVREIKDCSRTSSGCPRARWTSGSPRPASTCGKTCPPKPRARAASPVSEAPQFAEADVPF